MKVVCFHNPEEENGYLSNWYLSEFTLNGHLFSSVEQAMMYAKAKCFADDISAQKILATQDVRKIKALGRQVTPYNDHIWAGVRQIAVYEALLAKFSQNEALKAKLLATQSDFLAECAVHDKIWGIGLSMTDPARLVPEKWQGSNLLGYSLMKVREKLAKKEIGEAYV